MRKLVNDWCYYECENEVENSWFNVFDFIDRDYVFMMMKVFIKFFIIFGLFVILFYCGFCWLFIDFVMVFDFLISFVLLGSFGVI